MTFIDFTGLGNSAANEVTLSSWAWVPVPCEPGGCFPFPVLPDPQAVAFAGPFALPQGETVDLASLNILIDESVSEGSEFQLLFGDGKNTFGDGNFGFVPTDDGSHILTLVAVPEPGTCLLLFAGISLIRRRLKVVTNRGAGHCSAQASR